MQRSDANDLKYATRFRQATNEDSMIKYESPGEWQYTAGGDGETVAVIPSLVGARIIQIERELKPMYIGDWAFNSNSGQITLLNDVSMAAGETLFIIYTKIVIE